MKQTDAETFLIGAGSYYLLSYLLAFYPAMIIACEVGYRTPEEHHIFVGFCTWLFVFFLICRWFFMYKVTGKTIYVKLLVTLYGVTLWPLLMHIHDCDSVLYEFKGFNWIPFF